MTQKRKKNAKAVKAAKVVKIKPAEQKMENRIPPPGMGPMGYVVRPIQGKRKRASPNHRYKPRNLPGFVKRKAEFQQRLEDEWRKAFQLRMMKYREKRTSLFIEYTIPVHAEDDPRSPSWELQVTIRGPAPEDTKGSTREFWNDVNARQCINYIERLHQGRANGEEKGGGGGGGAGRTVFEAPADKRDVWEFMEMLREWQLSDEVRRELTLHYEVLKPIACRLPLIVARRVNIVDEKKFSEMSRASLYEREHLALLSWSIAVKSLPDHDLRRYIMARLHIHGYHALTPAATEVKHDPVADGPLGIPTAQIERLQSIVARHKEVPLSRMAAHCFLAHCIPVFNSDLTFHPIDRVFQRPIPANHPMTLLHSAYTADASHFGRYPDPLAWFFD